MGWKINLPCFDQLGSFGPKQLVDLFWNFLIQAILIPNRTIWTYLNTVFKILYWGYLLFWSQRRFPNINSKFTWAVVPVDYCPFGVAGNSLSDCPNRKSQIHLSNCPSRLLSTWFKNKFLVSLSQQKIPNPPQQLSQKNIINLFWWEIPCQLVPTEIFKIASAVVPEESCQIGSAGNCLSDYTSRKFNSSVL